MQTTDMTFPPTSAKTPNEQGDARTGRPARDVLARRLHARGRDPEDPARKQRHALAHALKALRVRRGLSQQALAEQAGWDQAFVARTESATGPWPKRETIARYAEICGATAAYVFGHAEDDQFRVDAVVALTGDDPDLLDPDADGEPVPGTETEDGPNT